MAGTIGLASVGDDFFVALRVLSDDVMIFLSDVTASLDWPLAGQVVEFLELDIPDDEDLDQVLPAGDMSIFADLGLDEMELGALSGDLDLYPGRDAVQHRLTPRIRRRLRARDRIIRRLLGRMKTVPYFSVAFARTATPDGSGPKPTSSRSAGVDDITDIMRETAVETAGDTVVLLLEQEDEWFAVVRLDDGDDPRVFLSDPRATLTSDLAHMLHEQIGNSTRFPPTIPSVIPALLADLGIDAARTDRSWASARCPATRSRSSPSDAGFAEDYDRLR